MIPGEIRTPENAPPLQANTGLAEVRLVVANTGDRPIQVGSHFHFYEVNSALKFDREKAGRREVYGLNNAVDGPL
jgi:urease subunit beta